MSASTWSPPAATSCPGCAGDPATRAVVERRSNRLARALLVRNVGGETTVGVLCCDAHWLDGAVAVHAVSKLGARGVVLPAEVDAARLRALLAGHDHPRVVLGCHEGGELWQQAGLGGLLIGDTPGHTWWRLVESQASAAPLPTGAAGVISLASGDGSGWAALDCLRHPGPQHPGPL